MIFVTVGSQLPFDRMSLAVAEWARSRGREDLFFQNGVGGAVMEGFPSAPTLSLEEIARKFDEAAVVVAHAGTGSIIECLSRGKPIIIVPRASSLGETRNDHQFATAERFAERAGVFVARNEHELGPLLDRAHELTGGKRISTVADEPLTATLRSFISDPKPATSPSPPRVLAVSSQGGHWVQLRRLRKSFHGCDVTWASTDEKLATGVHPERFVLIRDSNRWNKLGLIRSALSVALAIAKTRPDIIVSTGAAPGYFAVRIARLLGIRSLWIDSIANAETLSLSGARAMKQADLTLVQWPELGHQKPSRPSRGVPYYSGSVL